MLSSTSSLEVAILAVSIGTVPLQHLLTTVVNDCSAKTAVLQEGRGEDGRVSKTSNGLAGRKIGLQTVLSPLFAE